MPTFLYSSKARRTSRTQAVDNPLKTFMAFCSEYLKHSKDTPDRARAEQAAQLLKDIPSREVSSLINDTHLAGNNLLIIAILQGAKGVAEGLIPHMTLGALCDVSHAGMSAVSAACAMGYDTILCDILDRIIERSTDQDGHSGIEHCKMLVNHVNNKGDTPLILAARAGNVRMCITLLKYAKKPLSYLLYTNKKGESALRIAAAHFATLEPSSEEADVYMSLFQYLHKKKDALRRLSISRSSMGGHGPLSPPLRANRLLIWPPLPNVRTEKPRPTTRRSSSSSSEGLELPPACRATPV